MAAGSCLEKCFSLSFCVQCLQAQLSGELEEGKVYMVEGSDGYYIIYFENYGAIAWEETAEASMKDRDYETWFLDASIDYPFEVTKMGESLSEY